MNLIVNKFQLRKKFMIVRFWCSVTLDIFFLLNFIMRVIFKTEGLAVYITVLVFHVGKLVMGMYKDLFLNLKSIHFEVRNFVPGNIIWVRYFWQGLFWGLQELPFFYGKQSYKFFFFFLLFCCCYFVSWPLDCVRV